MLQNSCFSHLIAEGAGILISTTLEYWVSHSPKRPKYVIFTEVSEISKYVRTYVSARMRITNV